MCQCLNAKADSEATRQIQKVNRRLSQALTPRTIGVVNPNNKLEVVKIYEISDGAIATSGTYERGAHIHDPLTGMIAIGAASATVVGPLGWLCDAMATAVMVGGAR